MHELEMIDKILNVIADQAKKQNFTRVKTATLKVGRMNGLEKHHFTTALAARRDEVLAGTEIDIDEIAVTVSCNHCKHQYIDERFNDPHFAHSTSHAPHMYLSPPCPSCAKEGTTVLTGQEMILTAIDGE